MSAPGTPTDRMHHAGSFTTGRTYGPEPQRIDWYVTHTIRDPELWRACVHFCDRARSITGYVLVVLWKPEQNQAGAAGKIEAQLLADYDAGRYSLDKPAELGQCAWFHNCARDASELVPHPVLGNVPACTQCARFARG